MARSERHGPIPSRGVGSVGMSSLGVAKSGSASKSHGHAAWPRQ